MYLSPRSSAALLIGGVLVLTSAARGQYVAPQNQPKGSLSQVAGLIPGGTQTYAAAPVQQPAAYVPPSPYYGGYYIPTPAQGYLDGVASVTNANAQYQVTIQQARQAQSQADMSKLDVRHRLHQEQAYERSLMPDPEQVRLNEMRRSLARSRRNPPPTDIWSATALNDLLMSDQGIHRDGIMGPAVPVDPEILPHINVTTGTAQGSVGALNDGKPMLWPDLLKQVQAFQADREMLDKLVAELVEQERSSPEIDLKKLTEAQRAVGRLESTVRDQVADLTPDQYMGAKRFLNQLRDALKVLREPEARNYFNRKWAAEGKTVPQMIDGLTRQGLKFAAATRGDEVYYTQLYNVMLTYDIGLTSIAGAMMASSSPPPQPQRR